MIAKDWTLSGLSVELGIDRRTLAKRLEGLTPASQRRVGKRTERYYRMAAVLEHLANPEGETLDLTQERAKLARLQSQKIEIELGLLRGEVVRMPIVEQHWQGMVAAMRARLLALPARAAAMVSAPEKLQQTTSTLQDLIHEALEEISGSGIPAESVEKQQALAAIKPVADDKPRIRAARSRR